MGINLNNGNKIYATLYSNLHGVDFTQNPSAVYKTHSPTAVNMISDEGGNPRKRMGWEVKVSSSDGFKLRDMWAFEYNNEEHLICLVESEDISEVTNEKTTKYEMARYGADTSSYITLGTEISEPSVVGFYVGTNTNNTFCIMADGKIYTYLYDDEDGYCFEEIKPKIPTILIGQSFDGGGTVYEATNLLTKRVKESFCGSESYTVSGSTRTYTEQDTLIVSHDVSDDGDIHINISCVSYDSAGVRSAVTEYSYNRVNGVWDTETPPTITDKEIKLPVKRQYAPPVSGEDNVTVEYEMVTDNQMFDYFKTCSIATLYENKVFMSGADGIYHNYVWYSYYSDPSYFPDTSYCVIGSNESGILGIADVGEYLGVVKSATATNTTVYFLYSTTFEDNCEYACKQFLNGVGAVSTDTFASVSDEQLYLAQDGIYAINSDGVKNRSYYINKKLCAEEDLKNAHAVSWNGYYILCINNRAYILDTRQKTGWGTEWTNYSYECYYWENIPSAKMVVYSDELWFIDTTQSFVPDNPLVPDGSGSYKAEMNLARFKRFGETGCYGDGNYIQKTVNGVPMWDVDGKETAGTYDSTTQTYSRPLKTVIIGTYTDESGVEHYITDEQEVGVEIWEETPVPIYCEWSTPLDDDGSAQLFKTLMKKGSMATIIPQSSTSAKLYLVVDGVDKIYIGEQRADRFFFSDIKFEKDRFSFNSNEVPMDVYIKKKVKKYKRLQILISNNVLGEPLTIQGITKTYTVRGYSKRSKSDGSFTKET